MEPFGLADWTPRARPGREPLDGRVVRLEPLDAERHAADLFRVSVGDPELWEYMAYGPFETLEEFRAWLARCEASDDPLFFAIVRRADDRALGMASYLRTTPEHGVIEIGHIWFGEPLRRTRAATEAIWLLMRHVFDDLGYRRLEWKCDAANAASRRAADRFGFRFDGIFEQHQVVKGRNRDTAWYAILDRDWPALRPAYAAWLAEANFDAQGCQREPLRASARPD